VAKFRRCPNFQDEEMLVLILVNERQSGVAGMPKYLDDRTGTVCLRRRE
jgi:hypothetical protein